MPITPAEAKRRHEAATAPPADVLTDIDETLARGTRWLAVPQVVPRQYVEGVIRAYTAVGWTVRLVGDQRDGDALVFSENVL